MNMPAYKDSKTGTWFVKFYCKDWTGENKQIKKRGFATKREALDYERNYKIRQENNLDMTLGEFWKLYTEDVKNYVKLNTWLTKEHIVDTKILSYFKNLKMNEITPGDVRKWQNEMVAFRNENGKSYSQTYKKTMHNILSAIFNHACRFYNLKSNPARQAGNMGREEKKEMLFWTTEEYKKFSEAVIDKPVSFYAFEMLYWTGMRLGELLALTMEDFDLENISEKEDRIQQIEDRQKEIYRESSSRKRSIKNEEQYREYQIWHMEVQEELDELKQEKRNVKRQIQLADDIIKEDLYTAYYAVTGKEEIVADRDVEIPGMEEDTEVEKATATVVEPDANVEVMNLDNNQNEIGRQKEPTDGVRKQQTDFDGIGTPEILDFADVNLARMDESITDVTDKSEYVETKENEPVYKVGWIVRRISELGGYENVSDSVKADIFGFDIADVSGSIMLFSDVVKKLGIKLAGDELYEEFQRIYDESVGRDAGKEKAEDKMWNMGRGR